MVRLEDYGTWEEALRRLEESRKALLLRLRGADPSWLTTPLREEAWTPLWWPSTWPWWRTPPPGS